MVVPRFEPRDTMRAQALRNAATPAERRLWQYLSKSQIGGYKFSRQIPVGPYICDFVCRRMKLVVELDGYSHDFSQAEDLRRTRFLEGEGFTVLRFSNDDVASNVEGVVACIGEWLEFGRAPGPPPAPPARGRGVK